MKLIKEETHIDFLGKRTFSLALSGAAVIAGIVGYFVLGGLNYGIDFTGGTLMQVRLDNARNITEIREAISESDLGGFSLQTFGDAEANEYLITLAETGEAGESASSSPGVRVEKVLKKNFPSLTVRRVESVGPKVGEELKLAAFQAIVFSVVAIVFYVWLRFQWRYSIGALIALFHDVLIVLAAFVITGKEISLPVVAAILTVAGYSINDTIVIFDRMRENLRRFQKKAQFDSINESINQTLSRTILTSATTMLVVLALFLFGGEIINDFAFALLIGVAVGTYSSIFIAAPMVYNLLQWVPVKIK